jgi:hypothetical protein
VLILYLFLTILALSITAIFRQMIAPLRSWSKIKDRWFRVGIDHQMLFNTGKTSSQSPPPTASTSSLPTAPSLETIYLRGIYSDYHVTLSLTAGPQPFAQARVTYPPTLQAVLQTYPEKLLTALNALLALPLTVDLTHCNTTLVAEPTFEAKLVAGELQITFNNQNYRLHPQLLAQLQGLRGFALRRGKFSCAAKMFIYTQPGLLFDPAPLLPILDEMVASVKLWAELGQQMLEL